MIEFGNNVVTAVVIVSAAACYITHRFTTTDEPEQPDTADLDRINAELERDNNIRTRESAAANADIRARLTHLKEIVLTYADQQNQPLNPADVKHDQHDLRTASEWDAKGTETVRSPGGDQ